MSRLAALLVFVLAAACGARETAAPVRTEGVVALSDQFTGEFSLVGKDGAPVSDEDFEGKVMLVYFGFTNCPDVCPGDIGVMSATLNELTDAERNQLATVFISVDPERDTPKALSDYFAFDQRIIPLTGTPEAAASARAAYKMVASKETLPDSALGYTVNHWRGFYINDRKGKPKLAVVGGATPQELAGLLRREINH